jgi:peptidoglycan hydrolase-like amidase
LARVSYVKAANRYVVAASNGYFGVFFNPIQLVPTDPGIVMEITSYSDPNWNGSVNYNRFRGIIELVYAPGSNRVWVVEELPLEDYLRGISEEPNNYEGEFLKTMAVAERSYAYYHAANNDKYPGEPYQLKNSRLGNGNDQVYAGYNFEAQAPNVSAAVSATAGQVVTYGGTPVITPYYSRSDGRTRSAQEVWGSNWPWCISVNDPWWLNGSTWQYGGARSLLGHGVGLSAQGARGFIVNNGWNYQQALSYYYTATGIGAIGSAGIRVAIYSVSP